MHRTFFKTTEVTSSIIMGRRTTRIKVELVDIIEPGRPAIILPVNRLFCELMFPVVSVDEAARNAALIVGQMNENINRITDWEENRKLDRDAR